MNDLELQAWMRARMEELRRETERLERISKWLRLLLPVFWIVTLVSMVLDGLPTDGVELALDIVILVALAFSFAMWRRSWRISRTLRRRPPGGPR